MIAFLILFLHVLVSPFRTRARLEAEIVLLRHQLNVLRRRVPSIGGFQLHGISFHFSAQCAHALPQSSTTSATAFIVAKMIWAHLKRAY
jgi:hypothetical protein